jgi:glycosyltransferase involved in cell wall biosynthesis
MFQENKRLKIRNCQHVPQPQRQTAGELKVDEGGDGLSHPAWRGNHRDFQVWVLSQIGRLESRPHRRTGTSTLQQKSHWLQKSRLWHLTIISIYSPPAMKVLFDHSSPFSLAHGGIQVQIEQTQAALKKVGVEVEPIRWWDDNQRGDLIHFFGAANTSYQALAAQKGIPLVQTVVFSETCNRPPARLMLQALVTRSLLAIPVGRSIKLQLTWMSFRQSPATIVGLESEARILRQVYGVPAERIWRLPLGCEEAFMDLPASHKTGDYLVCVGTITPQKRTVELAEMALAANTPVLFIGKPYSSTSPYWKRFQAMVDGRFVRHEMHVANRLKLIELLQNARGFTLFSTFENWSLATDEAAACGLPLLLPDMNWSRERFGDAAQYFTRGNHHRNAEILRSFFDQCPNLPAPPRPASWNTVAVKLKGIYEKLLSRSSHTHSR